MRDHLTIIAIVALTCASLAPARADAFCGFYVGGADAPLKNDATVVVLMRQGTRTVLSMQNTYEGPPEGFAMVVPVPEIIHRDHVQTLPPAVFERIDRLSAPRLVEYWERDPCNPYKYDEVMAEASVAMAPRSRGGKRKGTKDLGVKVEAEFSVAEYDIVILSAKDSSGLETWLQQEEYNIPDGAASCHTATVEARRVRFAT